jgi:hypothetical protein
MDENCIVKALDVFQCRQQKLDIVSVYGAHMSKPNYWNSMPGVKDLQRLLGSLGDFQDILADSVEISRIPAIPS